MWTAAVGAPAGAGGMLGRAERRWSGQPSPRRAWHGGGGRRLRLGNDGADHTDVAGTDGAMTTSRTPPDHEQTLSPAASAAADGVGLWLEDGYALLLHRISRTAVVVP
jgi:hypothetical protein